MTAGRAWLIVGGAGYIGSHVTHAFQREGLPVVVFDDLSTGRRERLPADVAFVPGDCADPELIRATCRAHGIGGVVHLAALKQARESTREPLRYWVRNVGAMLGVVDGLSGTDVTSVVLSSSCSVYGAAGPVTEASPVHPVSPYGRTKAVSEQILRDSAEQLGLSWIALRYFNVIGNATFPSAHDTSQECLVPAATRQLAAGQTPVVFGTDHPTPDGSCLRDYVDVRDLADAHLAAARLLAARPPGERLGEVINVASGRPLSVLDILTELYAAHDRPVEFVDAGAREGDPPAVWAEAPQAITRLSWRPTHDVRSSVTAHVTAVRREERPPGSPGP